jgi:O-acetyl-ADP-ribose deacetylase
MKQLFNGKIEVLKGDITALEVDGIVNAANSSLMGGGGVDGAIHRAGGSAILEECKELRQKDYPDGLPAGEAVLTSAGKLHAKGVIHTVGPVWHGGTKKEAELLESAYRNSLRTASEAGFETAAFPAVSTGVYGFPKDKAAKIAYDTITSFLDSNSLPQKVLLVFFSPGDYDIFLEAAGKEDI